MNKYSKGRIWCMGLSVLLTQVLYWVTFFRFHDVFTFPRSCFHPKVTYEQWNWMLTQPNVPYQNIVTIIITFGGPLLFLAMTYFIYDILFGKTSPLRGALRSKLAVGGIGILLYVVLFIWNYRAPIYYLYMDLSFV